MQILVWKDKHGDYFYDASTSEALEKSAQIILKQMVEMGYIQEPDDPMKHIQYSGIDMEQASLTDEQIAELPTSSLRDTAKKHKLSLARRLRQHQTELDEFRIVMDLVAGKEVWSRDRGVYQSGTRKGTPIPDARITAWWVVQGRGGEYEQFSVETVIMHDNNSEETS